MKPSSSFMLLCKVKVHKLMYLHITIHLHWGGYVFIACVCVPVKLFSDMDSAECLQNSFLTFSGVCLLQLYTAAGYSPLRRIHNNTKISGAFRRESCIHHVLETSWTASLLLTVSPLENLLLHSHIIQSFYWGAGRGNPGGRAEPLTQTVAFSHSHKSWKVIFKLAGTLGYGPLENTLTLAVQGFFFQF